MQFLGNVTSDDFGQATISFTTEVVGAYAAHNHQFTDSSGIADVFAAGALSLGANTIPLDWIRIYFAVPDQVQSVFGVDDISPGGGLLMSSSTPIQ